MKPLRFTCGLLVLALVMGGQSFGQVVMSLGGEWRFRPLGDEAWLPATVPGTVHTDLLANGQIADPFFGENEKAVQWIEDKDWEYQKEFRYDPGSPKNDRMDLVFEGLDTYTRIFLNGTLLLSTDNMFRTWRVDVTGKLKKGNNILRVLFYSATRRAGAAYKALKVPLPDDSRVMVRKAPYQFGWDWGPRLVTAGIWKAVYLESVPDLRIHAMRFQTLDIQHTAAATRFAFQVESPVGQKVRVVIQDLSGPKPRTLLETNRSLRAGVNSVAVPVRIKNPRVWECNGPNLKGGRTEMYTFRVEVTENDGSMAEFQFQTGIRTIRLLQEGPAGEQGFAFELNGQSRFARGANWIPPDNFVPGVTYERYKRSLAAARDAGLNMLRVWGGGVYPDDSFFRLADEMGIMIWQDFMFACAMYPGDSLFMQSVAAEARDQVQRLQTHPSLVLWCGNNEISEGWHNWGWQKSYGYSPADSARIWSDYLKIFHQILPAAVDSFDGSRPYHPSSPVHGWGRTKSLADGDSHYWGVWWGGEPFEKYREKTGRFVSEFGFQSAPEWATLRECLADSQLVRSSPGLKNHQKHPRGFQLIDEQIGRYFYTPKRLSDWVYLSQLTQAFGMEMAIRAQLSAFPRCMGSLFWQFNDCWPVISWSALDYRNRPKALWYRLPELFRPFGPSFMDEDSLPVLNYFSEATLSTHLKVWASIRSFEGKELARFSQNLTLETGQKLSVFPETGQWDPRWMNQCYVVVEDTLSNNDSTWTGQHLFFPGIPKYWKLPDPALKVSDFKETMKDPLGGYRYLITVQSLRVARDVQLSVEQGRVVFSDNYFHMPDKGRRTVEIQSDHPLAAGEIQIRSLFDLMEK